MDAEDSGSWNEWSKYVLKELTRLTHSLEEMEKTVSAHTIEIAKLKITFAIYSAIAAFVATVVINILFHIIK